MERAHKKLRLSRVRPAQHNGGPLAPASENLNGRGKMDDMQHLEIDLEIDARHIIVTVQISGKGGKESRIIAEMRKNQQLN
jgi:hypothetical protein